MPTDLRKKNVAPLGCGDQQAALLSDALMTNDALLVSRALHDIAHAQGQSYGFGDDPALSVVLAALQALDLELVARPAAP